MNTPPCDKENRGTTRTPTTRLTRIAPAGVCTIYAAGGETSGIELARHISELYFDHDVAVKTAHNMEYRGPAWQR